MSESEPEKSDAERNEEEGSSILEDGGVDTDERAGRSLGIEPNKEPDDETKEEMEEERERRLDPDNRPDGAEVDNTDRTFDAEQGMFTDNDDYDESGEGEYDDPEAPENQGDDTDEDDGNDDSADESADDDSDEEEEQP